MYMIEKFGHNFINTFNFKILHQFNSYYLNEFANFLPPHLLLYPRLGL